MPSSFLSTFVRLVALEDPRNGAPRYVPRRGKGDFLFLPALVHVAYTRSVVATLRLSSRANQYHARSATSALKPLSALLSLSRRRVAKADNDEREDSDSLLHTHACLPSEHRFLRTLDARSIDAKNARGYAILSIIRTRSARVLRDALSIPVSFSARGGSSFSSYRS